MALPSTARAEVARVNNRPRLRGSRRISLFNPGLAVCQDEKSGISYTLGVKAFEAVLIAVTGALLGGFLGTLLATAFPHGKVHELFSSEITAGLHPANLD